MRNERFLVMILLFFVFVVVLGIVFSVVRAGAEPGEILSVIDTVKVELLEAYNLLYVGGMDMDGNGVPDVLAIQLGTADAVKLVVIYDYYGGSYLGRIEIMGTRLFFLGKGENKYTEVGPRTGLRLADVLPDYVR